jgi:hypothetical protein
LSNLSLKNQDLEDILANIGAHQTNLTSFRLESTSIKNSKKAGKLISDILIKNLSLSTLSFKNSDLSGVQMGRVLSTAPKMQSRVTLDLSGVFLTEQANEALKRISENPGNIQDIKLDGTNLEQRESERIIRVLEKSVLKIGQPTNRTLGLHESSIMASRFSVVWNSLQTSRYKQSKYMVDYSTLHLYADYPRIKARCSCERVADVGQTYICVDCCDIRCDFCAETSFSLYCCSKCSKVNESSVTLIHPRTCTNCNECPKCETLLKNDVGRIDRAGTYYFYSCPFCKWNSIRCSVTSKKQSDLFNQAEDNIKKNLEHRKKDLDNFLNMRQLDFLFSSSYYDNEVTSF